MNFFVHSILGLVGHPNKFFSEMPECIGWFQALCFLVVSAIFFSVASLMHMNLSSFFMMGGIYLLNAVGMVVILTGLAYGLMIPGIGKKVRFSRLFSIYALSSGVTLLVSWIPYSVILTEPWRWWLIATGMTRGCGLSIIRTLLIIGLSVGMWIVFVWTLIPILRP